MVEGLTWLHILPLLHHEHVTLCPTCLFYQERLIFAFILIFTVLFQNIVSSNQLFGGLQYCVYHEELIGPWRCWYIQCKVRSWCTRLAIFKVAKSWMEIYKETWPYCDSSWLLVIAWMNPVKNAFSIVDLAEIISELTMSWDGTVAINMKAKISLFW